MRPAKTQIRLDGHSSCSESSQGGNQKNQRDLISLLCANTSTDVHLYQVKASDLLFVYWLILHSFLSMLIFFFKNNCEQTSLRGFHQDKAKRQRLARLLKICMYM